VIASIWISILPWDVAFSPSKIYAICDSLGGIFYLGLCFALILGGQFLVDK
jgi:hypothetical protein